MTCMPRLLTFCLLSLVALAPLAKADNYSEALDSFRSAGGSEAYFEAAYGYVLFPTIGKGGIGIGGARGNGKVYRQGQYIGDSSMTQLTLGFQLGAQAFSQIIFFENATAVDQFISGNFEFGAQATAVALTAGVSAEASTGGGVSAGVSGGRNDASSAHLGYRKGMAVFTIAKGGLMYEATLGGQKFSFTPSN